MKDPFNTFIEDSVYENTTKYYKLMFQTKRIFFDYLMNKKSTTEFKKELNKIWDNIDHTYMKQRIKELEDMIEARDLKGRQILNPDAEYDRLYDMTNERKFINIEGKYKNNISNYYKGRLKTVKKEYIDDKAYLSKLVDTYEEIQAIIPYHNKDGTVRSWHNIASYSSMLYNTNLTHAGWNRTLYDSRLLNNEILYLPAHTFACPLCIEYQGKLYSNNGTSGEINGMLYRPMEIAIEGGVGHPNCRHQWTIYWDKSQIQDDDYNSDEWYDKYQIDQKIKALSLKRKTLKNDREIYKKLENQEEVDKVNMKLRMLNKKIKELKNG